MPRAQVLKPDQITPGGYTQTGDWVRREGEDKRFVAMPTQDFKLPEPLKNRKKYDTFLRNKYGNPYEDERTLIEEERKVPGKIDETTRTNEKALFEYVFGNSSRYEDRKHLDNKAQAYWKDALLKYRKKVEEALKQGIGAKKKDIEARKSMFQEQMTAFDQYANKSGKTDKPKYTTKNITDYYAKHALDKDNKPVGLTALQKATIMDMIGKSDATLEFVQQEIPESKKWFGADIPARTEERLVPGGRTDMTPQQGQMEGMPPAQEHAGKIIRDTTTGTRYKSDGTNWIEIK